MRDLILGLARPMLRLLGRDDRGAFGVLIAILISGGVLLGMGALVLDVGRLYQERAELQNGADAAAFTTANHCVAGDCTLSDLLGFARTIADSNASKLTGGQQKVDQICGYSSGTTDLSPCVPTNTGSLADCPPNPSSGNYVDVRTSTLMPDNSTLLPPVLGRTILGNGNYYGTDVGACAQAVWGPLGAGNSFAMAISLCSWENMTGDSDYYTDPADQKNPGVDDGDGDPDNTAYYKLLPVYIAGSGKTCASNPSGSNLAGGFGWLGTDDDEVNGVGDENSGDSDNDGDAGNSCNAYITASPTGTTYTGTSDPGANVSAACQTALINDITYNNNQPKNPATGLPENPIIVYLPVFDNTLSTGNNGTYNVIGLAGFVLMGYRHMNFTPNKLGTYDLCNDNSLGKCIEGYFTPGIDPVGTIGGGANFGASAVQLTG